MTERTETPAPPGGGAAHPPGLLTLAGMELWERLSFYGLQVILAYYIYYSAADGGLGMGQGEALAIVGAYGGAVYLTQPVGAWIADRVLAVRYVVVVSGLIIMAGHVVIAVAPGLGGLFTGLGLIALGTGGLFPNILAMMGTLYRDIPVKRDAGFSIFYTGIMLGALLGPLITGFLQVHYGFHVGFTAAAVGVGIGLVLYVARWKTLPESTKSVPNALDARGRVRALAVFASIIAVSAVLISTSVIHLGNVDAVILMVVAVVSIGYFTVMLCARTTTTAERGKVLAFIPVFIVAVLFWTLVLQLFTTFAVYADTRVDLSLGPVEIPAAYISTFQVVAGIIAGPLLAAGWQKMGVRQPSAPVKLGVGLLFMALAYGVFASIPFVSGTFVNLVPVIFGMVVFGVAELLFAPIGISAATQLSPQAFRAQMMALWGMSMAGGATLSGFVGRLYDGSHEPAFFGSLVLCTLAAALVVLALGPWLRRNGLE